MGSIAGIGIAISILIGWSAVGAALACVLLPPVCLIFILLPEVYAERRPASVGRDLGASVATTVVTFLISAGVFYNLGYAWRGGPVGGGNRWLQRALTDPNPEFFALLLAISLPLGALVGLRLRGVRVVTQTVLLVALNLLLLLLLLPSKGTVSPSPTAWTPFVEIAHYRPLSLGFCVVGPLLLLLGDRLSGWKQGQRQ